MSMRTFAGRRIPPASLAELQNGGLSLLSTERLFAGKRAIVMGMPGALSDKPTDEQIVEMCRVLDECMQAGYVG